MAHQSERVSLMKSNFMQLHSDGYSISEIADKFNLTSRRIYHLLQEIADENGVSRESLLQHVHKKHSAKGHSNSIESRINPNKLNEDFDILLHDIDTLITDINTILQEEI